MNFYFLLKSFNNLDGGYLIILWKVYIGRPLVIQIPPLFIRDKRLVGSGLNITFKFNYFEFTLKIFIVFI